MTTWGRARRGRFRLCDPRRYILARREESCLAERSVPCRRMVYVKRLTTRPHVWIDGRTTRHNRIDDLLGRTDALQIKRRKRWQRSIPPGLFQLLASRDRASPRSLPRRQ